MPGYQIRKTKVAFQKAEEHCSVLSLNIRYNSPYDNGCQLRMILSGDLLMVTTWGQGWEKQLLLASNGQKLIMLLSILQCTGQTPTTKSYLVHSVNSVTVEKPCTKSKITRYFNSKSPLNSGVANGSVFSSPHFLKKDFEAIFNYEGNQQFSDVCHV